MLLSLLLACATEAPSTTAAPSAQPPAPAAPAAEPAAEPAHHAAPSNVNLGERFAADAVVPVDTLLAQAATYDGKEVVLEGAVKEVCQKKGCWHTIATADAAVDILVKDKEYKIFLPKDAAGKRVHVKGTFAVTELPEAEAKHYAEDAGRDPSTIVGPQKRYTLDVAGVKFLDSAG